MFSKILFSVLLLTCVYTYMLKSIKNNNLNNFQKMPDNFNFELNGIQTKKLKLVDKDLIVIEVFLERIFGDNFVVKTQKYNFDVEKYKEVFHKDIISRLKWCTNTDKQRRIFDREISSKLEKEIDGEDQKEIKNDIYKHLDYINNSDLYNQQFWVKNLKLFANFIERKY